MKFHNGCWLFKEGYECFAPQHVYEVKKKKGRLRCVLLQAGSNIKEIRSGELI